MDAETILCLETSPAVREYVLQGKRSHVHEIYSRREERGEFHTLFPDLLEHPVKFYEYTRMNKETFFYILQGIRDAIGKHSNFRKCISPEERLFVTLRFLSTGMAFRSMAFSFRMASNTISGIVSETCEAIWEAFKGAHMPVPTTDTLQKIALEYERLWNFPNCVGSIDGKHVRIRCPAKSGSLFYNYKKYFSVHLQGVADANCKFIIVDIGEYGRRCDSGVFSGSRLYQQLENNTFGMPRSRIVGNGTTLPHVLIGDQGYPLKEYLMRPYPTTINNEDREQQIFNYRLSRARRCIECAFGLLVCKWRCLKTELQVQPRRVDTIVKCTCILHNIVIDREGTGDLQILEANAAAEENDGSRVLTHLRRTNRASRRAYGIRDEFKNYFVNN